MMTSGRRAASPVPPAPAEQMAIAAPGRRSLLRGLAVSGMALAPALARADDANPAAPAGRSALDAIAWRAGGRPALWPALAIREGRHPPRRALAHRHTAILGQLHAAAGSARHHHRQWPVLRALPCRAGRCGPGAASADDPRHGRPAAAADDGGHPAISRPCRASTSSNARPMAAWNGAPPSSIRCSSPTA